jgi:hypothetical protein
MNQEQDEVLLERIKQLESENKQLKIPKKPTKAENFVDGLFALLPPILFGTAIMGMAALPIAGTILQEDTGNFYPKYTSSGTSYIYQEVAWGEDRVVWQGAVSPDQVAAKVKEFRDSWKKANE